MEKDFKISLKRALKECRLREKRSVLGGSMREDWKQMADAIEFAIKELYK
jgi:hypothetical protein